MTESQPQIKSLRLDQLRLDGGTQPRIMINEKVVDEYAELCRDGHEFPPVTVFFDGATHWMSDGFHRYHASKRSGKEEIAAEIHIGTQRDAILHSVGANATHGLRRTNADKRKAVLTLLKDEEWLQWTDSEIARKCNVNQATVTRHRFSLMQCISEKIDKKPRPRKYKTKHGTVAEMNVGKIGRRRPKGSNLNPVHKPKRALAQTTFNMPHDPEHGATAIVSAMGEEYAQQLIVCLTRYLNDIQEKVNV